MKPGTSLRPANEAAVWRFNSRDGQAVIEVVIARPSDLDAIDNMEIASFVADRFVRRNLRRMLLGRKTLFLLARIGGEVAGYLALAFRSTSLTARIYSLAVAPEHRRAGVAQAMLKAAQALTAQRGGIGVHLEVRESNARAIALYENAGFRLQGTRQAYYEDGEAALLFEAEAPHSPGEL